MSCPSLARRGGFTANGKIGGGIVIHNNIDARGAAADLAQALPAIMAEERRRTFDELSRRYHIR